MIRVFLADDHEIVREGVKRIVTRAEGMMVVGEAQSGDEVLTRAESETWDVLVLDLSMPGRSGLDVLTRLKQLKPALRIVLGEKPSDIEAVARARVRLATFARINLLLSLPVTFLMVAASHG